MPPRKSSIDGLPENVQLILNKELGKNKLTLDGLVELLKKHGCEISRSAMGRYAQSYRKEIERMRRVQQVSDMMIAEIGEAAAHSKLGRTVAEMVKIVAFDHLAAREAEDGETRGEADPRDLMFIARAIRDAVSAGKIELEQELTIRRETAKKAADAVETTAKKAGLSEATIAEFRKNILGIVGREDATSGRSEASPKAP